VQPAVRALRVAPQGVFATIAHSLSGVLAAPGAIVVPILVDLFLWLGLRLSPAALTALLSDGVRQLETLDPDAVQRVTGRLGALSDLTPLIALFAPSLLAGFAGDSLHRGWTRPAFASDSATVVALLLLGLVVVSIGINAVFRVCLAGEIRVYPRSVRDFGRDIALAWGRYTAFLLMVIAAVVLAISALAALVALMLVLGLNVGPLLILLVIPPLLLLTLLLAFVPDAIVLERVGPLRAALLSARVVRRNLMPSLGFFAVSALTLSGLSLVLGSLLSNSVGVLTAIAAYGFVTTGLARAQLQFFFDRLPEGRLVGVMMPTPH
jgi:hypothetical protein